MFIKLNAFECRNVISGLGLIILVEGMLLKLSEQHAQHWPNILWTATSVLFYVSD
jgi:hypothetical protein